MSKKEFLYLKIIKLRKELSKLLKEENDLLSERVLKISKELDRLILMYYRDKKDN